MYFSGGYTQFLFQEICGHMATKNKTNKNGEMDPIVVKVYPYIYTVHKNH